MTTHQMKLAKEPFDKINRGEKKIESRLFDEKRQQIKIGDRIEFSQNDNPNTKCIAIVKALLQYPSFSELFTDFPPEYFGGDSKEALLQQIHQFYSTEDENQFGIVGIKIEKI